MAGRVKDAEVGSAFENAGHDLGLDIGDLELVIITDHLNGSTVDVEREPVEQVLSHQALRMLDQERGAVRREEPSRDFCHGKDQRG